MYTLYNNPTSLVYIIDSGADLPSPTLYNYRQKAKKFPKYLDVSKIVRIFAPTNPARFPQEQRTQRDIF
jgi:hypothetical protein